MATEPPEVAVKCCVLILLVRMSYPLGLSYSEWGIPSLCVREKLFEFSNAGFYLL